jgi:hypothetical protein
MNQLRKQSIVPISKKNSTFRTNKAEEGFGLTMSVGFSLVAMLIALAIIGRSFKDTNISVAQKTISRSLSAAEAGVSRYLVLINKYRHLSRYSDCLQRDANGVCTDTGAVTSWSNSDAIPSIYCPSSMADIRSILIPVQTRSWQNLDPADPSKGQYKLVRYTPPSSLGGAGSLEIDGRVNQEGSGRAARESFQTGVTRLKVAVPISEPSLASFPFYGLWINNLSSASLNNKFKANSILGCNTPSSISLADNIVSPYEFQSIRLAMPSLPAKPTSFSASNILGAVTSNLTIPRVTDSSTTENIKGVPTKIYKYSVSSVNLTGKNNFTVNTTYPSTTRIILYLDGNISAKGQAGIVNICTNATGTAATNCNANDLQIYGYNPTGEICVSGNGSVLNSFIFAPTYQIGVAGGGNSGGFSGAAWVNDWSNGGGCGSNTSHVVLTQTGSWENNPFANSIPPQVNAISEWKTIPVVLD